MIVLVDMDGVLADFEHGFLENWRKAFPTEIFIPPQKRTTFKIYQNYPLHLHEKIKDVYSSPGFFKNLPPIKGSIGAIKEMISKRFDIWICTSPISRYENCVLEKFQWIEKYFGKDLTRKMILTKDKTLVKGDFLIDDNPIITGIAKPTWEHLIFNSPYNEGFSGKRISWDNWKEILSYTI